MRPLMAGVRSTLLLAPPLNLLDKTKKLQDHWYQTLWGRRIFQYWLVPFLMLEPPLNLISNLLGSENLLLLWRRLCPGESLALHRIGAVRIRTPAVRDLLELPAALIVGWLLGRIDRSHVHHQHYLDPEALPQVSLDKWSSWQGKGRVDIGDLFCSARFIPLVFLLYYYP